MINFYGNFYNNQVFQKYKVLIKGIKKDIKKKEKERIHLWVYFKNFAKIIWNSVYNS